MFNELKIYINESTKCEIKLELSLIELNMLEYLNACMIYTGKELKDKFKLFHSVEDTEEYNTYIIREEVLYYVTKKITEWENGILR